jgi:hypothetical protein
VLIGLREGGVLEALTVVSADDEASTASLDEMVDPPIRGLDEGLALRVPGSRRRRATLRVWSQFGAAQPRDLEILVRGRIGRIAIPRTVPPEDWVDAEATSSGPIVVGDRSVMRLSIREPDRVDMPPFRLQSDSPMSQVLYSNGPRGWIDALVIFEAAEPKGIRIVRA